MPGQYKILSRKNGHWGFSGALAASLSRYGYKVDEALAFGLSASYGFTYCKNCYGMPSRSFIPVNVKPDFYYASYSKEKILWQTFEDFPWEIIKKTLEKEIPLLVLANTLYLPFNNLNSYATNHVLLLEALDETKGEIVICDNSGGKARRIQIEALAEAMSALIPPLKGFFNLAVVERPKKLVFRDAVKRSLMNTIVKMLYSKSECSGITGLRKYAGDIKRWKEEARDLKWCAVQGHRTIAGPVADGGNYRFLFAGFLREATQYLPKLKEIEADSRMKYCGGLWYELSNWFKEFAATGDTRLLQQCSNVAFQIAREEEGIFRDILEVLTGKSYCKNEETAVQ